MKKLIILFAFLILITTANAAEISIRPIYGYRNKENEFLVQIRNNGDEDIDDAQITVFVPDINYYFSSGNFDLNDGDTESEWFFINLPRTRGYYPIGIYLQGDDYRQVEWTWIAVV
ncbi:hypothetical protein GF327_03045 [Candidatus Woesearchaeota archaeon]|nr:hypothetical protein [Candidatus Woesearchaeota archaeon]